MSSPFWDRQCWHVVYGCALKHFQHTWKPLLHLFPSEANLQIHDYNQNILVYLGEVSDGTSGGPPDPLLSLPIFRKISKTTHIHTKANHRHLRHSVQSKTFTWSDRNHGCPKSTLKGTHDNSKGHPDIWLKCGKKKKELLH